MVERSAGDHFWDGAFAWSPFEPEPGEDDWSPDEPLHEQERRAGRVRIRRDELRGRRTARAREAQRRRRTRLYPLLGAVALLVIGAVLAAKALNGSDATETGPPPPRPTPPASSASPAPVPAVSAETASMRMGESGEAVRALQQALTAAGHDAGAADGEFAAATRDALVSFQQAEGLEADGVVGPQTAATLARVLAERAGSQAETARRGLADAAGAGRLEDDSAERFTTILEQTLGTFEGMTLGRAANLAFVLDDVASHADAYDEVRALVLFSMLQANAEHFSSNDPPKGPTDIEGEDGVVYRFFRARGFQFHPIANFAKLNTHVANERPDAARQLATALVARGVEQDDALVWEYYFPFGGPARWESGFAQGVAADALSRTGVLVEDEKLLDAAERAFRAIPGRLARPLGGGMWIREYGYSDLPILNAQLQTLLSVSRYAETADDEEARAFADQLETASRTLLPHFDHGACWSRYSLESGPAPPNYHRYHIALLESLDERTGEPPWGETARRWKRC